MESDSDDVQILNSSTSKRRRLNEDSVKMDSVTLWLEGLKANAHNLDAFSQRDIQYLIVSALTACNIPANKPNAVLFMKLHATDSVKSGALSLPEIKSMFSWTGNTAAALTHSGLGYTVKARYAEKTADLRTTMDSVYQLTETAQGMVGRPDITYGNSKARKNKKDNEQNRNAIKIEDGDDEDTESESETETNDLPKLDAMNLIADQDPDCALSASLGVSSVSAVNIQGQSGGHGIAGCVGLSSDTTDCIDICKRFSDFIKQNSSLKCCEFAFKFIDFAKTLQPDKQD